MENENEVITSINDETADELEGLDADALKEKYRSVSDKYKDIEHKNRQLFERLQKERGFDRDEDGNWIKVVEKKTEKKPDPKKPEQTEEFGLLQKTYLRTAGVTEEDEVELARDLQKKWNMDWDKLVDDEDFKSKLQRLRDGKANAAASDVSGGRRSPTSNAKNTPEFWIQKGTPPDKDSVPDRKTRAAITRAMLEREKNSGGKFYND